ncbi:hypothetical protein [Pectinatus haikarae]|uniref:Uncharacterized protein n=1 Tax=Pectinatus haikarae TaxID=349096 RepID=A0ABT9Y420_9FIRM|nr:hypothetical protein [Pectinatus haikarae]MDQ0202494.1 hypothetical protein [Pectinatus haikarae]
MSKKVICAVCLLRGELNEMRYIHTAGYFRCPVCKTETWPNPDEPAPDELEQFMTEMAKTHYSTDALPAGEALKGRSGSSNMGKNADGGKKKKTPQQLYNQLFKET